MTKRTYSDLITNLFQDGQAAGSITPARVRDLCESMKPSFSSATMEDNATATTISVIDTYVAIGGTMTVGTEEDFTGTTAGQFTYDSGMPARHGFFVACLSMTADANNDVFSFAWIKNGSTELESKQTVKHLVSTDEVGGIYVVANDAMTATDYYQLQVKNETDTDNLTVTNLTVEVRGLFT